MLLFMKVYAEATQPAGQRALAAAVGGAAAGTATRGRRIAGAGARAARGR